MARPVKTPFTEDELNKIRILAGYGLTLPKIANVLSIGKATLERRLKYSPGGADALEKGRNDAEAAVTQSLFKMATSGKVPAATFFFLKCRARWSEKPSDSAAIVSQERKIKRVSGEIETNTTHFGPPSETEEAD